MRDLIKRLPPMVVGLAAMIIFAAVLITIVVYIEAFSILLMIGIVIGIAQWVGNAIKWSVEDD